MRFRVCYEVMDGDVGLIHEQMTYIDLSGEQDVVNRLTVELHKLDCHAMLIHFVIDDEDDLINSIADYFY